LAFNIKIEGNQGKFELKSEEIKIFTGFLNINFVDFRSNQENLNQNWGKFDFFIGVLV
jgi:hypothetical protein